MPSEKQGKTKVTPLPQWRRDEKNLKKRLKLLVKRVENFANSKGAPPLAILYVEKGIIRAKGTESLTSAVKRANLSFQPQTKLNKTDIAQSNETVVDVCGIDIEICWDEVTELKTLRKAYARIVPKPAGSIYPKYKPDIKPEFWPEAVPFVSHSAKNETGQRIITMGMIRKVLTAFCSYCRQKQTDGAVLKNIPSETTKKDVEEIECANEEGEVEIVIEEQDVEELVCGDEDGGVEEVMEEQDVEELVCGDEDGEVEEVMEEQNEDGDEEIDKQISNAIKMGDVTTIVEKCVVEGLNEGEERAVSRALEEESLTCLTSFPKSLKTYKGPKDLCPGQDAKNIWHLLHDKPDVAKLKVFLFAREHLEHYLCQYKHADVNLTDLKSSFGNTGNSTSIANLLIEESYNILSDDIPSIAGWMFIAGALGKEVSIHKEAEIITECPPCPCNTNNIDYQQFYYDNKGRVYSLTPSRIWRLSSANIRKTVTHAEEIPSERIQKKVLPGVKNRVILKCFGYDVWESEIARVRNNDWLDDSIVNVLLRNEKERHPDVALLDSTFARKYLVPKYQQDCVGKLQLTASNLELVKHYHKRWRLQELRVIVLPICNNVHWLLAAFFPQQRIMHIMCSMGSRPNMMAIQLRAYFLHLYEQFGVQDIAVDFPPVPRQQNGSDCGVFTIEFGISIMKQKSPDWKNLGCGDRGALLELIRNLK